MSGGGETRMRATRSWVVPSRGGKVGMLIEQAKLGCRRRGDDGFLVEKGRRLC